MAKRKEKILAGILVLLMIALPFLCRAPEKIEAYTAAEKGTLKASDIEVSRDRYLRSAAAHVKRANQLGYGYNRVLNGVNYKPLAASAEKFCCVDLVTHTVYTATASKIKGAYKSLDETLKTEHAFSDSNGLVFNTQTVSVLGSQLAGIPALYKSLGSSVSPGQLRLGDIVLTGDREGTALNHSVLVLGQVTASENAILQIPNHNPDTSYFISMSSTSLASYRGISWLNRPWYNDDPDKGYFIKAVYRPLYDIKGQDPGGFRIKKTDAAGGQGLSGAVFELTGPGGFREVIEMTGPEYTSSRIYPPGDYRLTETRAPEGYLLDPVPRSLVIRMDEINSVYWDQPFPNSPADGSLRIHKKDKKTGQPVPGTIFLLSQDQAFPEDSSIQVTTGPDGTTPSQIFPFSEGDRVYVRELFVPAPYVLDREVREVELLAGTELVFEFHNDRAMGRIEIRKSDRLNGEAVRGAVFQIRDQEGEVMDEIATDEEGRARSRTLPLGVYTVREIEAEGYVPEDTIYTVELLYQDMTAELVTAVLSLDNQPVRGRIRIIKRNLENEERIRGAVFVLLDAVGNAALDYEGKPVPDLVTNEAGEAMTPLLRFGRYLIREIEAPEEYYLDTEDHWLEIREEGKTEEITVWNKPVRVRIRIEKTDRETGEPLAGAVFQILDPADLPLTGLLVTDEEGLAETKESLPTGDYKLVEVEAPPGYSRGPVQYFSIGRETGDLSFFREGVPVLELLADNKPTELVVSKRSLTGEEEIPGALLKIIDKEEGDILEEWISVDEPHLIRGLQSGRTYILREVEAPRGYSLSPEIEFVLSDSEEVQSLVMRDDLTRVRLVKKDKDTGDKLPGVGFQIEDEEGRLQLFSWQEEEQAWAWAELFEAEGSSLLLSDEKGEIEIRGLPQGRYQVREIRGPAGYVKLAEPVLLTVTAWSDGDSPVLLILENVKTEVLLEKRDGATGLGLAGARVEIMDERGKIVLEAVSDQEGRLHLRGLSPGSYTYRELEAPKGYIRSENLYSFTLDEEGRVSGDLLLENEKEVPMITPTGEGLPGYFYRALIFFALAGLLCFLARGKSREEMKD